MTGPSAPMPIVPTSADDPSDGMTTEQSEPLPFPSHAAYDRALLNPAAALAPTADPALWGGRLRPGTLPTQPKSSRRWCVVYSFETAHEVPQVRALRCFTDEIPPEVDIRRR